MPETNNVAIGHVCYVFTTAELSRHYDLDDEQKVCAESLAKWQIEYAQKYLKKPQCQLVIERGPPASKEGWVALEYKVICSGRPTDEYLKHLGIKK
ncbi:MAG: hypothetical protein HYW02_03915 [Deltaproteobacteria bacterium]|nr:hypothetical protein [Deltaproteobacteria bacterium]MBI2500611.1 hypothetical protein [Deltaproteobacteria bacterium]